MSKEFIAVIDEFPPSVAVNVIVKIQVGSEPGGVFTVKTRGVALFHVSHPGNPEDETVKT